MKLFKRALSVCLALAMVFSAFMMPNATTKASAAEYKPAPSVGQTVSVPGGELHPFTSTEDLIRDAVKELLAKNVVASQKEQDAALVAAVEEASDMTYENAKSTIAAALKDGLSLGEIDVSAFGLSKENMSKLMNEVLSDYYLYNAVSDLTYTTVGNEVTKVGFRVSEGFMSAMNTVKGDVMDVSADVDGIFAANATNVMQLGTLKQNPSFGGGFATIGKQPGADFGLNNEVDTAAEGDEAEGEGEAACTMHTVDTWGRMDIDFNGNEEFDLRDVLALMQLVADEDPDAVDVNGDGSYNVRDVTALAQFYANEEWPMAGGLVGVAFTWAEVQDYSPVFYMDSEGYYLDADGNRRFRMNPNDGTLVDVSGKVLYRPIDAEGNYVDANGNPAQPFNDSIANGGLLYNPETQEITTGLLPNIYYQLTGIDFHCSVCDQDIHLADDPETAVDELADFSQTQDVWVNTATGSAVLTDVGAEPTLAEGESKDDYILYTDYQLAFYYDDTFSFLTNPETGEMILDENGNPIPMYVMDETGAPILDEMGNVQVIGLFSDNMDNGSSEFMYYYSVLSAFNADHAEYFGVSTPYWTSMNTEETPIGALLSLCNMDPATPIVPAQMLMLVQMLPQAFMAYVYYYGGELLAMKDDCMAEVNALPEDATVIQKMLVIHDWLAENAVFDMGSMLNVSGTGGNSDPMQMTTFGAILSNQLTDMTQSNYYGGVCLAYAAAYTYLVQCAFPEIYKDAEGNWLKPADLAAEPEYNNLTNKVVTPGHIVDFSQVMFYVDTRDSSVAGEGFGGGAFNNVHYFNAVHIYNAHEDPSHTEENMNMGGMGGSSNVQDQVGKWFYVDSCYDDIYLECLSQYRVEAEGAVYHSYFMVSPQTMSKLWGSSIDYIDSPYDGYTYYPTDEPSDNIDQYLDDANTIPNPNYDPTHPEWEKVEAPDETKNHNTSYENSWFSGASSKIYFDGNAWYYVDAGQTAAAQTAMIDENGDVNIDFGDTGMTFQSISHSSRVDVTSQNSIKMRPMGSPDWWESPESDEEQNDMASMANVKTDPSASIIFNYGTGETGNGEAVSEALAAAIEEDFIYRDQFPALTHSIGLVDGTIFFNLGNQIWTLEVEQAANEEGAITFVGKNPALFKEYNTVRATSDGRPFKGSSYSIDPNGTDLTVENNPIAALCVRDTYTLLYNYYDAQGNLVMDYQGNLADGYTYENVGAAIAGRAFVAIVPQPTMTVNIATNWSYTAAFRDGMSEDEQKASIYTAEAINYNPDYTLGLSDDEANSNKEFLWCANIREDILLSDLEGSVDGEDKVPCTAHNDGHTYVYNETEDLFMCSECKLYAFNIVSETEHADVTLTAITTNGMSQEYIDQNNPDGEEVDTTVNSVSPEREGAISHATIDVKVVVEEGYGLPELTYIWVDSADDLVPEEAPEETPEEGGEADTAAEKVIVVLTESEEEPGVYTGTIVKEAEGCLLVSVAVVPVADVSVAESENGTVTVTFDDGKEEIEIPDTPEEGGEVVTPAAELTLNEGEAAAVKVGETITVAAQPDEGYDIGSVKYSYVDTTEEEVAPAAEGDEETGDGEGNEGEDQPEVEGPVYVDVVLEANEDGTYTFEMPNTDVIVSVEFVKLHGITVVADEEAGTVTVDPEDAVEGATVTVTVETNDGYVFEEVTVTYQETVGESEEATTTEKTVEVTAGEVEGTYTFIMPATDVTVTASFSKLYNVTVPEVSAEGTVTADKTSVKAGETVTLTITPEAGFVVGSVSYTVGEGEPVVVTAVEGVYAFEMPEGDVTVTVTFSKQYNVAVGEISAEEGSVTPDKTVAVAGETVTLTITPVGEYEVDTVSYTVGEGEPVAVTAVEGVYAFEMPEGDVTVNVTFKVKTYTITVAATENGTVTANKEEATKGAMVSVTVEADEGYAFDAIVITSGDDSVEYEVMSEGVYGFLMPAGDVTVTVTFKSTQVDPEPEPEPEGYSITVNHGENGTASTDKAVAAAGDAVTLTVTANEGYVVESLTYSVNGGEAVAFTEADGLEAFTYTFNMFDGDLVINITFMAVPAEPDPEPTTYTATVNVGENGTATVDKASYTAGETVTLSVNPADGYVVDSITYSVNGGEAVAVEDVEGLGQFAMTFEMPEGNLVITVTFKDADETPAVPA